MYIPFGRNVKLYVVITWSGVPLNKGIFVIFAPLQSNISIYETLSSGGIIRLMIPVEGFGNIFIPETTG